VLVVDGGRGRLTRCEIFGNKLAGVEIGFGGDPRARSHCRFVPPPLIRFIPYAQRESVPLFLKRQCDQTLGDPRLLECRVHDNGISVFGHSAGLGSLTDCDLGPPGSIVVDAGATTRVHNK
jgi:hypothetical protein